MISALACTRSTPSLSGRRADERRDDTRRRSLPTTSVSRGSAPSICRLAIETRSLTYLVEKQQVTLLAEKFRELLMMIDSDDTIKNTPPTRDPALALEGPLEPESRLGTMGLAYEESEDRVVVVMQPVTEMTTEQEDEEEAELVEREDTLRLMLRRDQVRSVHPPCDRVDR